MQAQTHYDLNVATFPELEAIRSEIGLSQAQLCRMIEQSPSTYQRWLKWANGEPGGSCPRPVSLKVLRRTLQDELLRRPLDTYRQAS
jgi:DNA-binding transcriptional regulator YiaG